MSEFVNRPLVTFALFTYNQEQYIREAIEGALAQDYSPLEIILSDDCSTDNTFAIMQSMANEYCGNARLILNCNDTNMGLARHVNKVMALATGSLIVVAAGDDISFPSRVTKSVDKWQEHGMADISIFSSHILIDESGQICGETMHSDRHMENDWEARIQGKVLVEGASHAWSANLFRTFGDLLPDVINEDVAIQFRASFMGGVAIISEPLIKYRKHSGSINWLGGDDPQAFANKQVVFCRRNIARLRNFERDVNSLKNIKVALEINTNKLLSNIQSETDFLVLKNKIFTRKIKVPELLLELPRFFRKKSKNELLSLVVWGLSERLFFLIKRIISKKNPIRLN